MRPTFAALFPLLSLLAGCGAKDSGIPLSPAQLRSLNWDQIEEKARGAHVNFGMWSGDEERNRLFQSTIPVALQQKFGITFRIVPCADTVELINKVLNERSAGRGAAGSLDMMWINGENFRTAKQAKILWGPFAHALPNIRFYDPEVRKADFGTAIDDYEAPWQKAQFVMAYDTARVPDPPRSFESLRTWIKAHPGRFTYVAPPDFTGSAFIRHILVHFSGSAARLQRGFDEALYRRASVSAIEYLKDIKPYLWRRGETYASTLKEANRLFGNQEVDFAMSYGPNFAAIAIERGEFPPTARTFVFDDGTLGNYSFLAIPFNASNPAAAMVAINYLMSFDQLLAMSHAQRDPFPLKLDTLTESQRAEVLALPVHPASLPVAELQSHFIPEPDAEYLTRFEKDWREKVLLQ